LRQRRRGGGGPPRSGEMTLRRRRDKQKRFGDPKTQQNHQNTQTQQKKPKPPQNPQTPSSLEGSTETGISDQNRVPSKCAAVQIRRDHYLSWGSGGESSLDQRKRLPQEN